MTKHIRTAQCILQDEILKDLSSRNISLTVGTDFEEYRSLLAKARPEHSLGAPFDPRLSALDPKKSFWIVGRDAENTIMHVQALKLLTTEDNSVGQFFKGNFHDFPPSDVDIDFGRSKYQAGPSAQRMTGRICYHGEVWMGGKRGVYRGSGLSAVLGRYALMMALQRLAPDYIVGFMVMPLANKGFVERQGYMHAEPDALKWYAKGERDPMKAFMVHVSKEDVKFLMNNPLT